MRSDPLGLHSRVLLRALLGERGCLRGLNGDAVPREIRQVTGNRAVRAGDGCRLGSMIVLAAVYLPVWADKGRVEVQSIVLVFMARHALLRDCSCEQA